MTKPLFLLLSAITLSASDFPTPYNSEPETNKPISAGEALAKLQLPAGFKATVFAAEPDVQNPIALSWDGRGRLWVAENYTYAESGRKFKRKVKGGGKIISRAHRQNTQYTVAVSQILSG